MVYPIGLNIKAKIISQLKAVFMQIPAVLVFSLLARQYAGNENKIVTQQITDQEKNLPMSGASAKVKGSTTGALANTEGKSSINVPANAGRGQGRAGNICDGKYRCCTELHKR